MRTLTIALFLTLAVVSMANLDSKLFLAQDLLKDDDIFLGKKGETGFIPVTEEKDELFYWYFPSEGSPSEDPLVIWLTGGPGCSSELAIFMENGPFKIDPKTLKVSLNKYSWNTGANLLYLDQPIGTGFSNPVRSDFDGSEDQIAGHFYKFLTGFLAKHPELNKRQLFIVGESYAGHYVPAISAFVVKQKNSNINLVGFGIGNGLSDVYYQYPAYADFVYENKLVSESEYNSLKKTFAQCQEEVKAGSDDALYVCQGGVQEILGDGFLPRFNVYDIRKPCVHSGLCYDMDYIDHFIQQSKVQQILGVKDRSWSECNTEVHEALSNDWVTDLSSDIGYLLDNGITGLLYYGDQDFICNWMGGLAMANNVPYSHHDEFSKASLQQWQDYGEYKQAGLLTFVKVHGAGHLVPFDQPAAALDLLERFLKKWAVQAKNNALAL